jgi:predicted phage terminase large subunit-like protein
MFQKQWFRILKAGPAVASRVRYWDFAATEGGGKRTSGVLMARTHEGVYYVEDVVLGQWSSRERDLMVLQTAQLDRGRLQGQQPVVVFEKEGGSSGKDTAYAMARLLEGFPVHGDPPSNSKEVRAEPFSSQAEAGNVFLVEGAWNDAYLEELAMFPRGTYADQVDASSGAFNWLFKMSRSGIIEGDLITSARPEFLANPGLLDDSREVYQIGDHEVVFDDKEMENTWWQKPY